MLKGLRGLEESARQAFVEEAHLAIREGQDSTDALIQWMAGTLGVKGQEEQVVEYKALLWLSQKLSIPGAEGLNLDDMEAAVRRKIAEDSHDFLYPFMEVGSAVAYIGPKTVVGPKLELLETTTAGLIPSHSARDKMRRDWLARGARLLELKGQIRVEDIVDILRVPIDILKHASEATRASVITLSIVVALADGRFETEEERFTSALAEELGLGAEKVSEIHNRVNKAFWAHLTELGGGTYQPRSTEEELTLNLQAAQMALESCGSLSSFSDVVEQGFVGSLHSSMSSSSRWAGKLKTWARTPVKLQLGFATGMLCYIRERIRSDDNETLLRLLLAAIYRQHLEATAEHAEITEEDLDEYIKDREVENPADVLAETVVGKGNTGPVRKISLEPTKFER